MFGRRRDASPADRTRHTERGAWTQPGFVGAALVLVIVLVLAVVLIVDVSTAPPQAATASSGSTPTTAATALPSRSAGRTEQPRPPSASNGSCPAFAVGQTALPVKAPSHIEWTDYHGLKLPQSAVAGPAERIGSVARCFAQTPAGALLAVANIVMRHPVAPDWRSLAARQMLPGPGRDAYLQLREVQNSGGNPVGAPVTERMARLAGFRFVSYSRESTAVALLFRTSGGDLRVGVHTAVWSEGDWKLQMREDGADALLEEEVAGPEGYIDWGGA